MAAAGNVSAMEMDGTVRLMVLALMKQRFLTWPFPPLSGPAPWTPAQVREYKRKQQQEQEKTNPAPF